MNCYPQARVSWSTRTDADRREEAAPVSRHGAGHRRSPAALRSQPGGCSSPLARAAVPSAAWGAPPPGPRHQISPVGSGRGGATPGKKVGEGGEGGGGTGRGSGRWGAGGEGPRQGRR